MVLCGVGVCDGWWGMRGVTCLAMWHVRAQREVRRPPAVPSYKQLYVSKAKLWELA